MEVNRGTWDQRKSIPLSKTQNGRDDHETLYVYDSCPQEKHARHEKYFGYNGYNKEDLNDSRPHLLYPGRIQRAGCATTRVSSNAEPSLKEKTLKDYARRFDNSYSNTSEGVIKIPGLATAGTSITSMKNGNLSAGPREHDTVCRECTRVHRTHPNSDTSQINTAPTSNKSRTTPSRAPTDVQSSQIHFFHSGLPLKRYHLKLPEVPKEPETIPKQTLRKTFSANILIADNDCSIPAQDKPALNVNLVLESPANYSLDRRLDRGLGNSLKEATPSCRNESVAPKLRTEEVSTRHVKSVCNSMEVPEEREGEPGNVMTSEESMEHYMQRSMPRPKIGIKRTLPKKHEDPGTKHVCQAKLRSVKNKDEQSVRSSLERHVQIGNGNNSRRQAIETPNTAPLPSSNKNREVEDAETGSERLERSVNANGTEESRGHLVKSVETYLYREVYAREERIRNLKMLQAEQEEALDKLLNERKVLPAHIGSCIEHEKDAPSQSKPNKKRIQHRNESERETDNYSKKLNGKTCVLAEDESESREMYHEMKEKTAQGKPLKKRWLKSWKRGKEIPVKKAKSSNTKNKEPPSIDSQNQNLSNDEYTALMGLVTLSKD